MGTAAPTSPFNSLNLADLRQRRSSKWRDVAGDEIPAWVAESDFPLAPRVKQALLAAIEIGDTGYSPTPCTELADAFVGFADRHWKWRVSPDDITAIPDATAGLEHILRRVARPGDRVAMFLPAYQPFFETLQQCDLTPAPLRFIEGTDAWEVDFAHLDETLSQGLRALLLNNPHNPTGKVFSRTELEQIAEIASAHNVFVLADEVHAPLTLTDRHTPWLSLDTPAAAHSATVTGATKAFNLAGLKCSLLITSGTATTIARNLPREFPAMTGHLGMIASTAALSEEDQYLAELNQHLTRNRAIIADWIATIPSARWTPPQGTYLAWLDLRGTSLGAAPARLIREHGGVVVIDGTEFDPTVGQGWIRLNFGTSEQNLRAVLQRIGDAEQHVRSP